MYNRSVPAAVRDTLIANACARNLPVEVALVERQTPYPLKSRFLRGSEVSQGEPIFIEAPTLFGSAVVIYPNEDVRVLMMVSGERYGFQSRVRRRTRIRLGKGVDVSSLELTYPARLLKLQRRRFYRAKIPALQPVTVHCITRHPEARGTKPKDRAELLEFDTIALDISSGGMGLKLPKRHGKLGKPGARIALQFTVDEMDVRLMAEIRYARPLPGSQDLFLGMQFIDWEDTLAGRRAINWISRYVVRRQRTELKKKSGLE